MNDQGSPKLTKDQLLEQIVDEFTREVRAGNHPDIVAFKSKFPTVANEIEDLLSSVAMIEELKQQKDSKPSSRQANLDEVVRLKKLGDYRIVRELGRGGMGVVLEAVHESLGRRVALKVLPARSFEDDKAVERFHREAQAAASLHHTNIVPVFGVGQDDGFNYYVMEFIEGHALNVLLRALKTRSAKGAGTPRNAKPFDNTMVNVSAKQRTTQIVLNKEQQRKPNETSPSQKLYSVDSARLPNERSRFQWTANLGAQIADALAYAHEQGTLHRDLKPANFLVDQDDLIWLTDFGLVKNMDNNSMTLTGEILGTPQYMAPESLEGKYDERSETYCLGLTLYELATLKPAFEDGSTAELIRSIMSTNPIEPKKVNRNIPSDLNTIIVKAISREPERRYQTAAELREDLRSFLADRPIQARRAGSIEQVWRWSRRNPWLATMSLVSMILLAATATTATVGYWIAESKTRQLAIENHKLEAQRKELERQRLQTENALADANLNQLMMQFEQERAEYNFEALTKLVDKLSDRILDKGSGESLIIGTNGLPLIVHLDSRITRDDKGLMNDLVNFYQDVVDDDSASSDFRAESARALRRVGNVYHMSGDYRDAVVSYDFSIRECKELLNQNPESISLALDLAKTRCQLGTAFRQTAAHQSQITDNAQQALMYLNFADDEFKRARDGLLNHILVDTPEIQFELAKIYNLSAAVWPTAGQRDIAPEWPLALQVRQKRLDNANASVKILDRLVTQQPENAEYLTMRVQTYRNRADFKFALKEETSAKEDLQFVFDECERLTQLGSPFDNENVKFIHALALGTDRSLDNEILIERFERVVEICQELQRDYEKRFDFQYLELASRIELAKIYTGKKVKKEAWKQIESAISLLVDIRNDGSLGSQRSTIRRPYNTIVRLAGNLGGESVRQDIIDRFQEEANRARSRRPRPR